MIKTEYKVQRNDEEAWAYKLNNIKNRKYYWGISKQDIDKYTTSSRNTELKKAISNNEIEREIIKVGTWDDMEAWEKDFLTSRNAAKDPMCYNESNGISNKPKLLDTKKIGDIADKIMKDHSYAGIDAEWVDIDKDIDKKGSGVLKPTSPLNDLKWWQVRDKEIDMKHVKVLRDLMDENHGQLENIDQDFLIVILENREKKNGKKGDYLVGGAHTLEAAITSEYVYKIRMIRISASVHSQWSEKEVIYFANCLNPRTTLKSLETDLDTIVKMIVDMHLSYNTDLKSTEIKDIKNKWCHSQAERRWVNNQVKKRIKDSTTIPPTNLIDWDKKEYKKIIDEKIKEYNKLPNTVAKQYSSGKANVYDYFRGILKEYYHGKKNLKRFEVIIKHPDRVKKEKWDNDYRAGFDDMARCLKDAYKIKMNIEEMPFTTHDFENSIYHNKEVKCT